MKRFATADIKAVTDESWDFEAVLSVPTLDRDGEIVDAKAFEPLPDHLTIDLDHAMTVEKTVASGQPFYEGDVLMFRGSFASTPLGQLTHTLVREGHIRTLSVAFMGAKVETDEGDGRPHIRSAELLNAAFTPVQSNRDALVTAVKSLASDLGVVGKTTAGTLGQNLSDAGRQRFAVGEMHVWLADWDPDDSFAVFELYAEDQATRLLRVSFERDGDKVTLGDDVTEVQRTVAYSPKSVSTVPETRSHASAMRLAVARATAEAALADLP